jgi:hypothetical protein
MDRELSSHRVLSLVIQKCVLSLLTATIRGQGAAAVDEPHRKRGRDRRRHAAQSPPRPPGPKVTARQKLTDATPLMRLPVATSSGDPFNLHEHGQ